MKRTNPNREIYKKHIMTRIPELIDGGMGTSVSLLAVSKELDISQSSVANIWYNDPDLEDLRNKYSGGRRGDWTKRQIRYLRDTMARLIEEGVEPVPAAGIVASKLKAPGKTGAVCYEKWKQIESVDRNAVLIEKETKYDLLKKENSSLKLNLALSKREIRDLEAKVSSLEKKNGELEAKLGLYKIYFGEIKTPGS